MRLSAFARGAVPALTLLLLASSAYHVASGLGRLVTSVVLPRSAAPPHAPANPESLLAKEPPPNVEELLARNPLDSAHAPPPAWAIAGGFLAAPDCETIVAHIVTESKDRSWSLASLSVAGEARPHLCRVGDELAGHRVEFIGFNPRQSSAAVWLSNRTRVCQASVAAGMKAPAPAPPAATASDLPAEIAANVERLSDSEFKLSRPAFQKLFENAMEVGRHLRLVPESKDGIKVGVRLFGVRPGTWLSALGIQNGDLVESINGFACANPEKLLEAYGRLPSASELSVKLTRRGSPMQLDVHIR